MENWKRWKFISIWRGLRRAIKREEERTCISKHTKPCVKCFIFNFKINLLLYFVRRFKRFCSRRRGVTRSQIISKRRSVFYVINFKKKDVRGMTKIYISASQANKSILFLLHSPPTTHLSLSSIHIKLVSSFFTSFSLHY